MAWAFNTDRHELTQRVGPRHEAAVTGGRGSQAMGAQRPTELVDGMGDMELLVCVDTDGDLWLGRFGDGGFHCGPSCNRIFGMG